MCAASAGEALRALESGSVILLGDRAFEILPSEERFLDAAWSIEGTKNVSLRPGERAARGARGTPADLLALGTMMRRYEQAARSIVDTLFPRYAAGCVAGSTSFRPSPIGGRASSWRRDDTRLHVDSFPSNPVHGRRILRVFSNVNPHGAPRDWLVGEPFEPFARRFVSRVHNPRPGAARILAALGITKRTRSAYDHFMLGIHDAAKADTDYQREAPRDEVAFAPGATWIAFTDQVVHAATAGQHAFEQTFYVDVDRMGDPAASPLAVLEGLTGRKLV